MLGISDQNTNLLANHHLFWLVLNTIHVNQLTITLLLTACPSSKTFSPSTSWSTANQPDYYRDFDSINCVTAPRGVQYVTGMVSFSGKVAFLQINQVSFWWYCTKLKNNIYFIPFFHVFFRLAKRWNLINSKSDMLILEFSPVSTALLNLHLVLERHSVFGLMSSVVPILKQCWVRSLPMEKEFL